MVRFQSDVLPRPDAQVAPSSEARVILALAETPCGTRLSAHDLAELARAALRVFPRCQSALPH